MEFDQDAVTHVAAGAHGWFHSLVTGSQPDAGTDRTGNQPLHAASGPAGEGRLPTGRALRAPGIVLKLPGRFGGRGAGRAAVSDITAPATQAPIAQRRYFDDICMLSHSKQGTCHRPFGVPVHPASSSSAALPPGGTLLAAGDPPPTPERPLRDAHRVRRVPRVQSAAQRPFSSVGTALAHSYPEERNHVRQYFRHS